MVGVQKLLVLYAGLTTVALCFMLISETTAAEGTARLRELNVERINVREPDGTLRMTLSGRARFPGIIIKGEEYPHPEREAAGMLFFNDEGSENGGLIFGGREVDGKVTSSGSLTFDRYEQDQVVQLLGEEEGAERVAGLVVSDRPERRLDFPALEHIGGMPEAQRRAAYARANAGGQTRVFVGREADRSSQLALRDGAGRTRLILRVSEAGSASIQFLDARGHLVRTLSPGGD